MQHLLYTTDNNSNFQTIYLQITNSLTIVSVVNKKSETIVLLFFFLMLLRTSLYKLHYACYIVYTHLPGTTVSMLQIRLHTKNYCTLRSEKVFCLALCFRIRNAFYILVRWNIFKDDLIIIVSFYFFKYIIFFWIQYRSCQI